MLEQYEEHAEARDVALELPTGTGKTLIGLLIAEWRRQARRERVLYLCPTRQLVYQVGALAEAYGIKIETCLRPDYEGLDRWQNSDAVAVSTYSSLFNYRPRFTAPQVLILDDAHAAEDYVAGHWTVVIGREEMSEETQALCFLAGANSIFYGPRLLTTPNPVADSDRALFAKLGLVPMPLAAEAR